MEESSGDCPTPICFLFWTGPGFSLEIMEVLGELSFIMGCTPCLEIDRAKHAFLKIVNAALLFPPPNL